MPNSQQNRDFNALFETRTFDRRAVVQRELINQESRTIPFVMVSRDNAGERYDWWEDEVFIEELDPKGADFSGLRTLFKDHHLSVDTAIGRVENARMENGEIKCDVIFGTDEDSDKVFRKFSEGILSDVSIGYRVNDHVKTERQNEPTHILVTRFQILELSAVWRGFDRGATVGREAEIIPQKEEVIMEEEVKTIETPVIADESMVLGERKRTAEILDVAKRFSFDGTEAIRQGMSADQFRSKVMDELEKRQKETKVSGLPTEEIGLTDKEKDQYSLVRALRDAASGKRDTYEFRVGEAAAKAHGIEARGLYVPTDLMMRTMSVVDTGNGGNTVATNILAGSFIDLLRAQSVVMGISTHLDGLVGNVQIPRQTGATTSYKPAEKVALTQSDITTDFISLSPQRYGASVPVTKQLLMQSSLAVEGLIRSDIVKQIALKIELDVISDILSQVTNVVALGTNGAAPTNKAMIDMETLVTDANAAMGNLKYLVNAKGRGKLKSTEKVTGYPKYIMEDDMINGYGALLSTLLPSNLVKGTSGSTCSAVVFGNFDDVIIGTWGGLDIVVDIYTQAKEGIINITADQFADYDLRHIQSFATIKDMLTV